MIETKFLLKYHMKARKMTQGELAELTGISRQSINKLCDDPQAIRIPTIGILCDKLGLEPGDLFQVEQRVQ